MGTGPYGGGSKSVFLEMPPTGIAILSFFTSKSSVNGAAVMQHKAVHGTQNVFFECRSSVPSYIVGHGSAAKWHKAVRAIRFVVLYNVSPNAGPTYLNCMPSIRISSAMGHKAVQPWVSGQTAKQTA